MSHQRHARQKKAHAKHRQSHRGGAAAAEEDESHPNGGGGGQAAPDSSSSAEGDAPKLVLFDGLQEEVLSWWAGELSREEKVDILSLSGSDLGSELQGALGPGALLDSKRVAELTSSPEFMTPARSMFLDAMYASGGEVSNPNLGLDSTLTLLLHCTLCALERRALYAFERAHLPSRAGVLLAWWVWSWSGLAWWARYPMLLGGAFALVALSSAASIASSSDPSKRREQSARWNRAGEAYLYAREAFLHCFDDDARGNPFLLRSRADLFLSSLLLLDLARWVSLGRYILLLFVAILIPAAILALEKGGSGRNKSLQALYPTLRSTASIDAGGLNVLRSITLNLAHLSALYYAMGNSWLDALFVAFFFFPTAASLLLSGGSISFAGIFLLFAPLQTRVLGEWSGGRAVLYWILWAGLVGAKLLGWTSSLGWMLWSAHWAATLLLTPPLVSNLAQLVGGGICAILLQIGVHKFGQAMLQLGQLILTREGIVELAKLARVSLGLLFDFLKTFLKNLVRGVPPSEAASAAAGASSGEPSGTEQRQEQRTPQDTGHDEMN